MAHTNVPGGCGVGGLQPETGLPDNSGPLLIHMFGCQVKREES